VGTAPPATFVPGGWTQRAARVAACPAAPAASRQAPPAPAVACPPGEIRRCRRAGGRFGGLHRPVRGVAGMAASHRPLFNSCGNLTHKNCCSYSWINRIAIEFLFPQNSELSTETACAKARGVIAPHCRKVDAAATSDSSKKNSKV
ncbi:hypothetical protein, partial [Burkholderia glumae]|uniref:hypothetical protein n=1 Tax=Burkholderia glumae TaxID=337 RepID=UPI0020CD3F31